MTHLLNDMLLPWSLLVSVAVIMFVLRKSHNQWQELALAWALALIGTLHAMDGSTPTPTIGWVFPLAAILVLRCVIAATMTFMWPGVVFALYLGTVGFACFDGFTTIAILFSAIVILLTSIHPWARTSMWPVLAKPLTGLVCGSSVAFIDNDGFLIISLLLLHTVLAWKLIPDPHEPQQTRGRHATTGGSNTPT